MLFGTLALQHLQKTEQLRLMLRNEPMHLFHQLGIYLFGWPTLFASLFASCSIRFRCTVTSRPSFAPARLLAWGFGRLESGGVLWR
jgi:hypothetical protein